MRLVHLSDLHLGFRQYQRVTPGGINQREADVAGTFRRAIERTVALAPELVLVAGDVFHNVRPTNPAILDAFAQFSRLRTALPGTPIVMIAGNHDTPRTAETGGILRLFRNLDIEVVDTESRQIAFPSLDLSVYAVPDVDSVRLTHFEPDASARWNVLLLHGAIEGMLPAYVTPEERALREIPRARLAAERWDYVALGHHHVHSQVAPNAWYAGAIEYTSANPWGELIDEATWRVKGKGIVEHDLATGAHQFHALPSSRPLLDLQPIHAAGMSPADIDAAIAQRLEGVPGGIDEKIVRLRVLDVPRHLARELDHRALREYKRRALHFHLDTRRPDIVRPSAGSGAPGRRPSLADLVRTKLEHRVLPGDVEREPLVALGLRYLSEAEAIGQASGTLGAALAGAEGASDDDLAGPARW